MMTSAVVQTGVSKAAHLYLPTCRKMVFNIYPFYIDVKYK